MLGVLLFLAAEKQLRSAATLAAGALVLLDEPFAGLDRRLVRELIEDLIYWSQAMGFSMIAVDHQAEVLKRLCPRQAIVLEYGTIVQQGTWDQLYNSPVTPLLCSHCWLLFEPCTGKAQKLPITTGILHFQARCSPAVRMS